MTHLRVPHLPVGQPDGSSGGRELRRREADGEVVEDRRVREVDGISRPRRRETPAVEDHERDERQAFPAHLAIAAAARQIAARDAGSSEAPPTSAPSTACCPSSSLAFSGFTEPP